MKYIIVVVEGIEQAIMFSELITHKNIGYSFPLRNIISAGFVNIKAGQREQSIFQEENNPYIKINCYGMSDSLKLQSRGKIDEEIIKQSIEFRL